MKKKNVTNKIISILFLVNLVFPSDSNLKALEIMKKVIAHPNPQTLISEVHLEIIRKKGGKRKQKNRAFISYEKLYTEGDYKKKSLVKFLEPKSVKGTGLLSWTKFNGLSEQWFFLPILKTAKKIKSKEKSKSFMSTDFIYEDLESREISDDSFNIQGKEVINNRDCIIIASAPIKESFYWGKKIYVDTKIWKIRKVEYFSTQSKLEKTLHFKDIVKIGKYWFPKILEMRKENGNYTIMKMEAFKPDKGLDDQVFTESFLIEKN
jgi:outer membrane lipoprotein-sorting protein|tara:strand:+ start:16592 stop:17383 length:792 start_codon:yes stop_codon:yes gene_type:complete